jgi:hypothetical protein
VCSCNACACEREEEAPTSEPATESKRKATLSEEPLRQETIERLKHVFAEMDLDGNHGLTSDEAQAFFVMLFDELPLKQLRVQRSSFAAPSESSASRRDLSRRQSAALFADVDANQDQVITVDEFVDFWQKVKAFGYSDKAILQGLTSALEHGMWRRWIAPVPFPAWASPLRSTTLSPRDPITPSAPLPDSPSCAVLQLQALAALDHNDSDGDGLDARVAKEWRLLHNSGTSLSCESGATATGTSTLGLLLPE